MSYLTDSYIIFTHKMESVSKNTIFRLKMKVKSGLEKYLWNSSTRMLFSWNSFYFIETFTTKLQILHTPQRFIFEIPPCAHKIIFVAEFLIL